MRPRTILVHVSESTFPLVPTWARLACVALVAFAGLGSFQAEAPGGAAVTFRQNDVGLERGTPVEIPGLIRAENEAVVVQLDNGRVVRLRPHSVAFFAQGEGGSIRLTVGGGIVEVHTTPDDLALAGERSTIVLEPHRRGPESPWDFVDDPTEPSKTAIGPEPEEDREQRRASRRLGEGIGRGASGR